MCFPTGLRRVAGCQSSRTAFAQTRSFSLYAHDPENCRSSHHQILVFPCPTVNFGKVARWATMKPLSHHAFPAVPSFERTSYQRLLGRGSFQVNALSLTTTFRRRPVKCTVVRLPWVSKTVQPSSISPAGDVEDRENENVNVPLSGCFGSRTSSTTLSRLLNGDSRATRDRSLLGSSRAESGELLIGTRDT